MSGPYSLPGYDLWKTTDPADDGSDEAIEQIGCELSRDLEEVEDAVGHADETVLLAVAEAFVRDTPEAREQAWERIAAAIWKRLDFRAVETFNARQEEARWAGREEAA